MKIISVIVPFYEIFIRVAEHGLTIQDRQTGAMPPGHNGPYNDPVTPVRSTSHWLLTFLKAHQLDNARVFRSAAEKAANYLRGSDAPRSNGVFVHRQKPGKDACNGLIGPAWTLQALWASYQAFGSEDFLDIAKKMISAHPFHPNSGLWSRVEPNGQILPPDRTFNHQLWFCMSVSLFASIFDKARQQCETFLDKIHFNLLLCANGRIQHTILPAKGRLKRIMRTALSSAYRKSQLLREVGYHVFNLYALPTLRSSFPTNSFWSSQTLRKALDYMDSREYRNYIDKSPYGFPYNPPGFEVPHVNEAFGRHAPIPYSNSDWLARQLAHGLNKEQWQLSRGTEDPTTATARIYETAILSDDLLAIELNI